MIVLSGFGLLPFKSILAMPWTTPGHAFPNTFRGSGLGSTKRSSRCVLRELAARRRQQARSGVRMHSSRRNGSSPIHSPDGRKAHLQVRKHCCSSSETGTDSAPRRECLRLARSPRGLRLKASIRPRLQIRIPRAHPSLRCRKGVAAPWHERSLRTSLGMARCA